MRPVGDGDTQIVARQAAKCIYRNRRGRHKTRKTMPAQRVRIGVRRRRHDRTEHRKVDAGVNGLREFRCVMY